MKCPRCGAENPPYAKWCSLCNHVFSPSTAVDDPPGEGARAVTGPGESTDVTLSYDRPVGTQPGYAAGAPGYIQAGSETVPSQQSNLKTTILIGLLTGTAIIVAMAIFLFFFLWRVPDIHVPTPPGWEAVGERTLKRYESAASAQDEKVTYHYMFRDESENNFIIVGHGDFVPTETPESEEFEDAEAFFWEQQEEWEEYFENIFEREDINAELKTYEVVQLGCGDGALHMSYACWKSDTVYTFDFLAFYKNDYQFFVDVRVEGRDSTQEEVDFLIENISFD